MVSERYMFHGKRLGSGEWLQGYLCCNHNSEQYLIYSPVNVNDYQIIDPATIGQCTGLRAAKSYRGDRPEDLLIFEGDAVDVYWDNGGIERVIVYDIRCLPKMTGSSIAKRVIIGNIHDNPELLMSSSVDE